MSIFLQILTAMAAVLLVKNPHVNQLIWVWVGSLATIAALALLGEWLCNKGSLRYRQVSTITLTLCVLYILTHIPQIGA